MISKLSLKNFQRHHRLVVNIAERILVVVGANDAGKTTLLRALRWICLNDRRNSSAFIRWGSKSTTARIVVDGRSIKRMKSPKENSYRLGDDVLKAVGNDVPEGVEKVLRVDSVNFQGQHDSAYWFNLSPGQIAKQMNAICDLDVMDRTQQKISAGLRKAKSEFEVFNGELAELNKERLSLRWIVQADKDYHWIEEQEEEADEVDRRIEFVDAICSKYQESIDQEKDLTPMIKSLEKILEQSQEEEELSKRIRELDDLLDLLDEASTPLPNPEPLLKLLKESDEVDREIEALSRLLNDLDEVEKTITSLTEGVCPSCGQPV